jgi:hypothetical protein
MKKAGRGAAASRRGERKREREPEGGSTHRESGVQKIVQMPEPQRSHHISHFPTLFLNFFSFF